MLFHVAWEFIDTTEEGQKRGLAMFSSWQPPAGAEFKAFYGFADGSGGAAILEVDSEATLSRTTAPWTSQLQSKPLRFCQSKRRALSKPRRFSSATLSAEAQVTRQPPAASNPDCRNGLNQKPIVSTRFSAGKG